MLKTKTTWICRCDDCLGLNSVKAYISTQVCLLESEYNRLKHLNVLENIQHGRLVHEHSLPSLKYLLDIILPFPHICTYTFEAWHSLTAYFT